MFIREHYTCMFRESTDITLIPHGEIHEGEYTEIEFLKKCLKCGSQSKLTKEDASWINDVWECYSSLMLQKCPILILSKCLYQLFSCIHHNGSMPCDWLFQSLSGNE